MFDQAHWEQIGIAVETAIMNICFVITKLKSVRAKDDAQLRRNS